MRDNYKPWFNGLRWNTYTDLINREFLFCWWSIFIFACKYGPEDIWLQAVPLALAYFGKPEVEALSTIISGSDLGWIPQRRKPFMYQLSRHWLVSSFTILFVEGLYG